MPDKFMMYNNSIQLTYLQ